MNCILTSDILTVGYGCIFREQFDCLDIVCSQVFCIKFIFKYLLWVQVNLMALMGVYECSLFAVLLRGRSVQNLLTLELLLGNLRPNSVLPTRSCGPHFSVVILYTYRWHTLQVCLAFVTMLLLDLFLLSLPSLSWVSYQLCNRYTDMLAFRHPVHIQRIETYN